MKKFVISIVIILAIVAVLSFVFDWGRKYESPNIDQNIAATGTNELSSTSTTDMPIVVDSVKDNQEVSSPIVIKGKARGSWFFEATFPVELVDADGNIISSTTARAESDWMTTDFVNFTAILEYTKSTSTSDNALIVLSNDNPSGNPDFDKSIFIPVKLK